MQLRYAIRGSEAASHVYSSKQTPAAVSRSRAIWVHGHMDQPKSITGLATNCSI